MSDIAITELRPGVTLLTLDRPDRLNALSAALVDELHAVLATVKDDHACRVVIITGAGRGFCAGLDLRDRGQVSTVGDRRGTEAGLATQERIADLTLALRDLPQPVISAVNGPAYGGGFAIALASDLRVAARSATFCTQFIKLGLGGCDIGVSYTLPRLIGATRAFELILTARTVDADEALRIGIVSDVVDDGTVVDRALDLAETLCGYTSFGVALTKQVLWANLDAPSLDAALHLENRNQILASTSGDFQEAVAAFLERRAPELGRSPAPNPVAPRA